MDETKQDNDAGDLAGDITWMTYAELGKARRISAASAKRLAVRRRWRRTHGNDGTARVAVPVTEVLPREDKPGDDTGDIARAITVLEGAVTTLRERAEAANSQNARLQAAFDGERTRADALRERLNELQAELAQAQRDAQVAQDAATAVARADDARRVGSMWRRLRRRWRGE